MIGLNELADGVLTAVLKHHKEIWPTVKAKFVPESFGTTDRIQIAKAIVEVSENGGFSIPQVIAAMNGENKTLTMKLYMTPWAGMNIQWMVKQLYDWHLAGKATGFIADQVAKVLNGNVNESVLPILGKIKTIAEEASNGIDVTSSHKNMTDALDSWMKRLEQRLAGETGLAITTSISKLDEAIIGLKGGRFYIIAARPSVGKTSFASFICFNAMKQGKKVLFFSNEMDAEDIVEKFLSMDAKIPNGAFNAGVSDSELSRLKESLDRIQHMNISIDEKSGWQLDSLTSVAQAHKAKDNCDMVVIDYMQQVKVQGNLSKYEQASAVSDALKKLSRDLNVPVIGLAQINREAEKSDQAPSLMHIKDSGSFEQDADVVMILHREKLDPTMNYTPIDLRIAKNRYGRVGDIKLKFFHSYSHYAELT